MRLWRPFRKTKTPGERIVGQLTDAANAVAAHASTTAASIRDAATDAAAALRTPADLSADRQKTGPHPPVSDTATSEGLAAGELRSRALQAVSTATGLLEEARTHAHRATGQVAADARPDRVVELVSERARQTELALVEQAQRLLELAKQAEEPLSASLAGAKDRSKQVATDAAEAGKSSLAIAFWATTLMVVLLYVIMGRERRDRAINRARAAAAEVQELVNDYRGYDGNMDSI